MSRHFQIVFLCGARDFHAMDWYKSSICLHIQPQPIILTDLINGEGFPRLVTSSDLVFRLILLDPFLLSFQSRKAHLWRNLLKLLVLPLQVVLIRKFVRSRSNLVFYAHSMYYIWLAWLAGVKYVGTPQGSDILVKPYKSFIYRLLSKYAMRSALFITVDSSEMASGVTRVSGVNPVILQNGIDTSSVMSVTASSTSVINDLPPKIVSFRGIAPLYRIHDILLARNSSPLLESVGLELVYPFCETDYLETLRPLLRDTDYLLGRVSRESLYSIFRSSTLCISIPFSDSSPRSVYECIFSGSIVVTVVHPFIHDLPVSMSCRVILVDIANPFWLQEAFQKSLELRSLPFVPCEDALTQYDQLNSFRRLYNLTLQHTA